MIELRLKKNGKPFAHVLCGNCGVPVYGSSKPKKGHKHRYCGMECYAAHARVHPIVVEPCVVCGIEVTRRGKRGSVVACGLECQRKWSGRSTDWIKRSLKAKAKWYRAESRRRRLRREAPIKRALARVRQRTKSWHDRQSGEGLWLYKIRTRVSMNRNRKARPRQATKDESYRTDTQLIRSAIKQLKRKRRYHSQCPWLKKIGNKMSNLAKRRRRKHVGKERRKSDLSEDRKARVQMCFEWDAD